MNTAGQNPSGRPRPAEADDPLLAEAMALTWYDYREEFGRIKNEPTVDEAGAGRMREAIRSDARLWPFADRPEFVEWAVNTAAGDSKDVSEVSAGEAMAALDAPRVKLVGKFLEVLKRHVNASAAYVRDPLQEVLNDDRAWTGHVGQFATAAVDDIHVARGLGVSVLDEARVRELEPYDALDAVKQARYRAARNQSWVTAKDQATRDEILKGAVESELAAKAAGGAATIAGSKMTGSKMTGCGPAVCAVSAVPLVPVLPRETGWAQQTDPCNSLEYLRYLVYTYAIGENGQLFRASELLADRWAQATNWCWPEKPAKRTQSGAASCQSLDDAFYCLRWRNAQTDTAYAIRTEIYQDQLKSPAIQQAWSYFVTQVDGYLSARCCEATTIPSYRCVGVYTAAEALRRAAAAQLTGLARMQIKELASSLQSLWELFTNPCVLQLIDPAAAGTACYIGTDPADQATVVFEVAQQLLGPQASGLYQAWDNAILLDQVFAWLQCGQTGRPDQGCEEDQEFVTMLGAMSSLALGVGPASSAALASPTAGAT
jgi:hypothetical protein